MLNAGLMGNSVALSIWLVDKPGQITADMIKKHIFRPIDETSEVQSSGWVNFDDMTDNKWSVSPPEKGQYLCFSFRVDTRKIQSAVFKKHLQEMINKEKQKGKTEKIGRSRLKEMKDILQERLKNRVLPVPVVTDVILDTISGHLYIGSQSSAIIQQITELLATFCGTPCSSLAETLDGEKIKSLLRDICSPEGVSHDECTIYCDGVATLKGADLAEITVKNMDNNLRAALDNGMDVLKAKCVMEQDSSIWKFTLSEVLTFTGLKLPPSGKIDEDSQSDNVFFEKMFLIEKLVNNLKTLATAR
jgi:hypothetical protein